MKKIKQITTVLIIALITLSSVKVNAQTNKQKVLNAAMDILVNTAKPFYQKGMSEDQFVKATLGNVKLDKNTGKLMGQIYSYVSKNNKSKYDTKALTDVARSVKSGKSLETMTKHPSAKWNWKKFFKILKEVVEIVIIIIAH